VVGTCFRACPLCYRSGLLHQYEQGIHAVRGPLEKTYERELARAVRGCRALPNGKCGLPRVVFDNQRHFAHDGHLFAWGQVEVLCGEVGLGYI